MRVFVYVDGFNLYYRALKGTANKWLDLHALASNLLGQSDSIEKIRYFTARVKPRPGFTDAPRKQQIYLNALTTLPSIEIHYGRFLSKKTWRPKADNPTEFVRILDSEEKGSDVNLASYLIHDGWKGQYDLALILSQDTDLVEPIRLVTEELKLKAGLAWLDNGKPSAHLSRVSTFVRHFRKRHFRDSQFPDPVVLSSGKALSKPADW